jgi:L-malate glycosyltransferase
VRIAFVCNEYPPRPHGGIGTFVQSLGRALGRRGHEITVVGLGAPGECGKVEWDADIRVVTLGRSTVRGMAWLVNRLRIHRWLSREARSGRIELIETPDFEGMVPFPFKACPVLVRLHLSATAIARQARRRVPPTLRWCESATLAQHREWLAYSSHALDITKDVFGSNPRSARVTGLILPERKTTQPGAMPWPYILFAGTVSERKGAIRLARAARRVLASRSDLHLVYAGECMIGEEILSELGREHVERLHLLGRLAREEVLDLMSRAAVFCMPSHLETFGFVVAEAMLQGCPVVALDAAPFDEIIKNGESGLLVNPTDDVALTEGLERVLAESAFAARLATAGRDTARRRFDEESVSREMMEVYEEALAAFHKH